MAFNINYTLSKQETQRVEQFKCKEKLSMLQKSIIAGQDPIKSVKEVFSITDGRSSELLFYSDIHGLALLLATPPSFIFKELSMVDKQMEKFNGRPSENNT